MPHADHVIVTNPILTQGENEGQTEFMERCAKAARAISGSVSAEYGTLCPTCAPFSLSEGQAEIVSWQACYNCEYGKENC